MLGIHFSYFLSTVQKAAWSLGVEALFQGWSECQSIKETLVFECIRSSDETSGGFEMGCKDLNYLKNASCDTANTPVAFARILMLWAAGLLMGCSQTQYRQQADQEAYQVIAERNQDPRWSIRSVSIEADPRSRFFDEQDPDHPQMPIDDLASNRYMARVDRHDGWKGWAEKGIRGNLENPSWRQQLDGYATMNADGEVELSVDSALRLAYLHSPLHQSNLETLYLSSLDVTAQRFRLDTQFFGGSGTNYVHRGDINPVAITYSPPLGDYVIAGPFQTPEANRFSIPTDLQARRRLATAGEVLVGFANSFTWDFTGADAGIGSSLANFSFVQPLLRGAGRKVALEQLTLSERRLLSNLRAYAQFRQGFFTQIVIGELGVTGPQRSGASTQLQSFSGFGGIGGYLGLLQQSQQIRNTQENLRLQLRTRERLEALYDNELIDIVQVDQFRQSIENTRSSLLDQTNSLELAVDNYKTQVLGLPSDLEMAVDQSLVRDFQLIPLEASDIVDSLLQLQKDLRVFGEIVDIQQLVSLLEEKYEDPAELSGEDAISFLVDLAELPSKVSAILFANDNAAKQPTTEDERIAQLGSVHKSITQLVARLRDGADEVEVVLSPKDLEVAKDCYEQSVKIVNQWIGEASLENRLAKALETAKSHLPQVDELRDLAESEMQRLDGAFEERRALMSKDDIERFQEEELSLRERLDDLSTGRNSIQSIREDLAEIEEKQVSQSLAETLIDLTAWVQDFPQVVERLSLIPAKIRLEVISVTEVDLTAEDAFRIALENRLDFMNGRAALVDRWRAIEIAANELESNLSIKGNWDIGTARNNMLDFRGGTSNLQLGVEFDAPLARLLERNGYRETLISFQRSRRQFIQSRDSLQKGLRALLRTLNQRRLQLEIQRRAVSIALRRVEQTQLSLLTPPPPIQPGTRPQINPTTAINLLGAQGSLQSTQNSFLAAWLNYYASRLRLYRELGVMELDSEGNWIENPLAFDVFETEFLSPADQSVASLETPDQNTTAQDRIRPSATSEDRRSSGDFRMGDFRTGEDPRARLTGDSGSAEVVDNSGDFRSIPQRVVDRAALPSERLRSAVRPSVVEYPVR